MVPVQARVRYCSWDFLEGAELELVTIKKSLFPKGSQGMLRRETKCQATNKIQISIAKHIGQIKRKEKKTEKQKIEEGRKILGSSFTQIAT